MDDALPQFSMTGFAWVADGHELGDLSGHAESRLHAQFVLGDVCMNAFAIEVTDGAETEQVAVNPAAQAMLDSVQGWWDTALDTHTIGGRSYAVLISPRALY